MRIVETCKCGAGIAADDVQITGGRIFTHCSKCAIDIVKDWRKSHKCAESPPETEAMRARITETEAMRARVTDALDKIEASWMKSILRIKDEVQEEPQSSEA